MTPRRAKRSRLTIVDAYLARDTGQGFVGCDVCGWRIAPGLRDSRRIDFGLEAHHVQPIARGGLDDISNIAILCPTHHRVAHRLLGALRLERLPAPSTVSTLVVALRQIDDEGATAVTIEDARRNLAAASLPGAKKRRDEGWNLAPEDVASVTPPERARRRALPPPRPTSPGRERMAVLMARSLNRHEKRAFLAALQGVDTAI